MDNAHWLDQPSADALLFVARRLQAEGIALLFAARDGEAHRFSSIGFPECRVDGLPVTDAIALMASRTPALPAAVMKQLIASTGGNPLALIELPSVLTAAELAGEHALPEPLPAGRQIELAFAATARRLDAGTQSLLLVTAAEETGASCAASRRWTGVLGTWLRPRSNRTPSLLQRWRLQPIELDDGLVHRLQRRPWNAARRSLQRTPNGEAGYLRQPMLRGLRVRRNTHLVARPGRPAHLQRSGTGCIALPAWVDRVAMWCT